MNKKIINFIGLSSLLGLLVSGLFIVFTGSGWIIAMISLMLIFITMGLDMSVDAIDSKSEAEEIQRETEKLNETISKILWKNNTEIKYFIGDHFLLSPCSRCADVDYSLLEINRVGTAIFLQCLGCNKKAWFKTLKVMQEEYDSNYLIKRWNTFSEHLKEKEFFTDYDIITIHVSANDIEVYSGETDKKGRSPIPQEVKDKVWNRDGGKCVQCGSNKNLEFDHIIPHSKGGANTYRNIQLLCEPCNRSKSAKIG